MRRRSKLEIIEFRIEWCVSKTSIDAEFSADSQFGLTMKFRLSIQEKITFSKTCVGELWVSIKKGRRHKKIIIDLKISKVVHSCCNESIITKISANSSVHRLYWNRMNIWENWVWYNSNESLLMHLLRRDFKLMLRIRILVIILYQFETP